MYRSRLITLLLLMVVIQEVSGASPNLTNPVLFVTQFPIANDFATIGSTFANHGARSNVVGRGGDLWIRYPDASLRNLTAEAGYGSKGVHRGVDAIAVRDPHVHWNGTKALISMAIGAPPAQYIWTDEKWQLYEVTGLGQSDTVSITRIAKQATKFNNITPVYGSDDRIIFTSDRPRGGEEHLYPQHDEYESTPTNTGLWSLDTVTGDLRLLQHSPSGSFTPFIDSYGRLIFTRWDHLQRDQQADGDELEIQNGNAPPYGTFDYSDESKTAVRIDSRDESFPEPRSERTDLLQGMTVQGHQVLGHSINHFFPWQINQDGTGEETLLHVGRHDLHTYFDRAMEDPNLTEFIAAVSGRVNPRPIFNMFQLAEDPTNQGRYAGIDAPEFDTHASGQVVRVDASPGLAPDQMVITYVTHRDTESVVTDGETASPNHSGHYRDPLYLGNGTLVAAHTAETGGANNDGSRANPDPRYDFRLKTLVDAGNGYLHAGETLTMDPGIIEEISYWDPDVLVHYKGPMWELSPTEVRVRPAPATSSMAALETPEAQIFTEEGIDPAAFRQDLAAQGVALLVSRNVTTRDRDDRQQPFNLSVPGGVNTTATPGEVYAIAHLQLFQGDQVRGIGGIADPEPGRRVIARPLHDPAVKNPPNPAGPEGSVAIAADGSVAALVPANRAMTWQITGPDGTAVVRERYWINFQPGEIRTCPSCHGLSSSDQVGQLPPQNPPEALRSLLRYWQSGSLLFADGFEG